MKQIALTLFVLGVATVNAGSVVTQSSSSGSSSGSALVNGAGAVTSLSAAGSAAAIAAQGGQAAGGSSVSGASHRAHGWEAQCDDGDLEECHHDIHIQNAGQGASGDAVSN